MQQFEQKNISYISSLFLDVVITPTPRISMAYENKGLCLSHITSPS